MKVVRERQAKGVVSYKSFVDLKRNEEEGKDYRITAENVIVKY